MNDSGCGIVTDRGHCRSDTLPGSPLNLCAQHIRQAAELYSDIGYNSTPMQRTRGACPGCNARALVLDVVARETRCAICGHRTPATPTRQPDPDPKRITSGDPVVYYLTFGNRVKIGYTADLQQRLSALPHDRLLGVERGGRDLESQRHRQFGHLRVTPRGEWFHPGPDLFAFIDANTHLPVGA